MKRWAGVFLVVVAFAVPASARETCFDHYLWELAMCDQLGGFFEIGCELDASMNYLSCVKNAALS
jgi:hypothetical protein